MRHLLITNNPEIESLTAAIEGCKVIFIDSTVQAVISKCEEIFLQGEYALAADPLGGRRARPFPYLTIILEKNENGPLVEHWNRIAQYSELNSKRIEVYKDYDEKLKADYRTLDCSYTRYALNIK